MKKLLIILILFTSCVNKTPELISINGFQHVLNNFDKSNIDEYLLKQGFAFKQQSTQLEDEFLFPKPLRHVYENKTTSNALEIAYIDFQPIEITLFTNDPDIYLKLKEQVKNNGFVVKQATEKSDQSTISYVIVNKKLWAAFTQRSKGNGTSYIIKYEDIAVADKATKAFFARNGKNNINLSMADSAKIETNPTKMDTTKKDSIIHKFSLKSKIYKFTIDDLYPSEANRADIGSKNNINGVIKEVDYTGNNFTVSTNDGEEVVIEFYPGITSVETGYKLKMALKQGNKIKAICAYKSENLLDLVSATITHEY